MRTIDRLIIVKMQKNMVYNVTNDTAVSVVMYVRCTSNK